MKKFIALLLVVITCVSILPMPVLADDIEYTFYDDDKDGGDYYVAEGDDMKDLFSFGLGNLIDGSIIKWIFSFKTFVVLKKYTETNLENDDGELEERTVVKGYWNTPNIQTLAKNLITADVSDGYTDDAYDVDETQWIVPVGTMTDKVNAITRYGFKLPNYTYYGEYPKEYMSIKNVIPTGYFDRIWRAIKTLFGFSFIDPPDASNFKTISYWNHEYGDKDEEIIYFIQDNFLSNFYSKIRVPDQDGTSDSTLRNNDTVVGTFFTNSDSNILWGDRGAADFLSKYITWDQYNAVATSYSYLSVDYDVEYLKSLLFNDKYIDTTIFPDALLSLGYGGYSYKPEWIDYFGDYSSLTSSLMPTKDDMQNYINSLLTSEEGIVSVPNTYAVLLTMHLRNIVDQYNGKKYQFNYLYKFGPSHTINGQTYVGDDEFTNAIKTYFRQFTGEDRDPNFSDMLFSQNRFNLSRYDAHDPEHPLEYKYDDHYLRQWYGATWTPIRQADGTMPPEIPYIVQVDSSPLYTDKITEVCTAYTNWITGVKKIVDFQNSFNAKQMIHKFNLLDVIKWDEVDKRYLYYSQCMISNQGEDSECWSEEYSPGDRVTISLGDIWVLSGLYKAVDWSKYDFITDSLTREDAVTIINTIKNYCGPYFIDVLDNMITLMKGVETATGGTLNGYDCTIKNRKANDYRVMPYDIDSMTDADKSNFSVVDPRVSRYKNSLIGGVVSDVAFRFNIGIYMKIQPVIVNLAGTLTEFSVLFQQLINFDILDEWGLSPATLWNSAFTTLLILVLVLFFVIKTLVTAVKFLLGRYGSIMKIIGMFLVLALEIGIFTAISLNPTGTWDKMKGALNTIMNLGESVTLADDDLQYLFGSGEDRDPATAYYLPYLDAWSMYNTGYGLLEQEQQINNTPYTSSDYRRERWGLSDDKWPTINGNKIEHWSILLLDSFEYHGDNFSLHSIPSEDGTKTINGKRINSNAYRVVDHFLAPRVIIDAEGDNYVISTRQNENYNGQFQTGFINIFSKLLNVILLLFLSIIKFLTFLWLWYQLYIFIFKVILARSAEKKSWPQILTETFSPLLGMIFIGAYAGLCIRVNANISGIIGLLIEVGMYAVTIVIIRWWSTMASIFPKTLFPIAALLNMKQTLNNHKIRNNEIAGRNEAARLGEEEKDENGYGLHDRERYFNEDGTIKTQYRAPEKVQLIQTNWVNHMRLQIRNGMQATEQDKIALRNFATYNGGMDFDYDTFERITNTRNRRNDRINHNSNDNSNNTTNNSSNNNSNNTTGATTTNNGQET